MKKYKVVSLFSGCGGLDYGFHKDFKLDYAADNDEAAVKCFSYNLSFPAKKIDVRSDEFFEDIKKIGKTDVVLGGFPCQGFSKAGPKIKDDPRNVLYTSMLFAVNELKPNLFIAENVDGMAQNFNGEFVDIIKADFESAGYNVEFKIINVADYGVPQYRRRIIFVGVKKSIKQKFCWPRPSHFSEARNGEFHTEYGRLNENQLSQPFTIRDAIGDLLNVKYSKETDHTIISSISKKDTLIIKKIGRGQKLCNVRFSNSSVYTWQIPDVFGEVSERDILILETIGKNRRKKIYGNIPNGNPLDKKIIEDLSGLKIKTKEMQSLVEKGYLKIIDGKFELKGAMFCSGLYKRPEWELPSPTVITMFGNPRYFLHPLKDRPFTIREAARLQSFPDNFKFLESGISEEDAFRLIGNAVPPRLSQYLASATIFVLNSISSNEIKKLSPKPARAAVRV